MEKCPACGKDIPRDSPMYVVNELEMCEACHQQTLTKVAPPPPPPPPSPAAPLPNDPLIPMSTPSVGKIKYTEESEDDNVFRIPTYSALGWVGGIVAILGGLGVLLGAVGIPLGLIGVILGLRDAGVFVLFGLAALGIGLPLMAFGQLIECLRDLSINSFHIRRKLMEK